jgi:hypothetical protein
MTNVVTICDMCGGQGLTRHYGEWDICSACRESLLGAGYSRKREGFLVALHQLLDCDVYHLDGDTARMKLAEIQRSLRMLDT